MIEQDEYTGEFRCQRCGRWFYPEDDLKYCPECLDWIDMKIEQALMKGAS